LSAAVALQAKKHIAEAAVPLEIREVIFDSNSLNYMPSSKGRMVVWFLLVNITDGEGKNLMGNVEASLLTVLIALSNGAECKPRSQNRPFAG
jgi:hypothetical protein